MKMDEPISISADSNLLIDRSAIAADPIVTIDTARHGGLEAPDEPPPPPTTGAAFELDEAVIAGSLL